MFQGRTDHMKEITSSQFQCLYCNNFTKLLKFQRIQMMSYFDL